MERTPDKNKQIQSLAPGSGITPDYHDLVSNFELSYKATPSTEQLTSLIHYHECFELILYVSADIEAYIDDTHYNLHTHDVLIVPPRKLHKIVYPQPQNYIRYVFYFTGEHIEKAFDSHKASKALNLFMDQTYQKASLSVREFLRINYIMRNMYEHISEDQKQDMHLLNTYSSLILQELYIIFASRPPADTTNKILSPVEQILKYINDHYSENITLEELEEKFYLNKSYICRIFRKTMGISLINYIQHKRILEAQQMLLTTDASIINISLECGFSNLQHFYRVFKKMTDLTPNEYKKNQSRTKLGQPILLQSFKEHKT